MSRKIIIVCMLATLTTPFLVLAQQSDKLTIDLFLDWEYVSNPKISPTSEVIVYIRRVTDKINDKYTNEIWIVNADGRRNRFLAKGSSAEWSPDGVRLAYIAKGEPKGSQIFVRWMDSGESTQVTNLENSPSNIQWSPDAKKIAFNMYDNGGKSWIVNMPLKPKCAKWV